MIDPSSISSIFVESSFFFFLERLSRKERFIVYLFILFLISEKFITSGLLLLFIVIKEKYLDRINFQSTIRQEKKSKKKNLLRVECTLRAKKVGSGFIIKIVETIFSISIFPPFSLSLSSLPNETPLAINHTLFIPRNRKTRCTECTWLIRTIILKHKSVLTLGEFI